MSALAGFLNGLADSKVREDDRAERAKELEIYDRMSKREPGSESGGETYRDQHVRDRSQRASADATGRALPRPGRMKVQDPVADDLPPYARAFLNSTAHGESAGAYNVRYTPQGGQTFELNGQHPRIFEEGPHGPSSAAGRYQFTATTWDDVGGGEFSEYNQDHQAWKLAQQRYRASTGRDLDGVLQRDGFTPDIMEALAPTWAAFGNASAYDDYRQTYDTSLSRYAQPQAAPAAAPAAQPASQPASQPADKGFPMLKGRTLSGDPKRRWQWANEFLTNTGAAT